jgi:hypothetical protein
MQFAGLDRAAKSGIEGALIPDCGTDIAFWKSLRALQSPAQRRAFRDRTDRWTVGFLDTIDFY